MSSFRLCLLDQDVSPKQGLPSNPPRLEIERPDQDQEYIQGRLRAEFPIDEAVERLLERIKGDPRFRGRDGKDGRNGIDAKVSDEQLAAMSQAILERMRNDPKFRGPKGDTGAKGKDGNTPDTDALTKRIINLLPDIQVSVNGGEPVGPITQPSCGKRGHQRDSISKSKTG